ncbi:C3a anaphylatoxin chemotactic receptor-like [Paramacrobiotus metropolitanus]|uniref:C3a anaphylatoxin chemotactic receptor-like n=1 Tax=Paramacrobiotus metropolitanus TaxID=2943436 RepID=UPI0024464555|nr:C3a anaphylatoxin chemotactic receptor-like [Paramacrobiotus metropolitanus]
MNNTTTEFDHTADHAPFSGRTILAVYAAILTLIIVSNTAALIILYRTKNNGYSAAFTTYLVHLFTVNILTNLLDIPLDIVEKAYSALLTPPQCALYTYVNWALMAVLVYSHLAITLNRLWAVVHPHSYRKRHTLRLAVGVCCSIWIVVHLCAVPLFAYRLTHQPENDVCLLDMTDYSSDLSVPVQIWGTVVFVVLFLLPTLAIVLLYPLIEGIRQRARRRVAITSGSSLYGRKMVADPRTFRMLLALTVSLLCTWMPQLIWLLLEDWITLDPVTQDLVDLVLDYTWTVQALLDPIMFIGVF